MDDSVTRSVEIDAAPERVWRALIDHAEFGRWFKVALDGPFAIGKPSTGHMTYPGYEHYPWKAEIVAIEPMTRFAFRWPHMDNDGKVRDDWPWTLVEFVLEPNGEGSRLSVTESGFSALPVHRAEKALRQNTGGWEEQMRNVKAHVEG